MKEIKSKTIIIGSMAIIALIAACVAAIMGVKESSAFLAVAVTFGFMAADA